MKKLKYIFIIFTVFGLCACVMETDGNDDSDGPLILGMINIEVIEQLGLTEDKMENVRFLIFKNTGANPTLELNERFDINTTGQGENEISKFKVTLKVEMQSGKENNKIVVAIINEPATLVNTLNNVSDYNQLLNIELDFEDFLNTKHTALQSNKTMPMCGVIWTNRVYATEIQAENNPVKLSLWRAPARIDIHLRKEPGMDFALGSGTEITLQNTYNKEYLVRYESGSNSLGHIQTLTSGFMQKTWSLAATDNKEIPTVSPNDNGRLICSFYTPERTCSAGINADKLILNLNVVTNEGTPRTAEIIIDRFITAGQQKQVDIISRNNIYKVIATVGTGTITAVIQEWNNEDIETEL